MTPSVTGITQRLKVGSSSSRPSTALSTEIAGVISASQKNSAVPSERQVHGDLAPQRDAGMSRRCASANSARMPPSPSLSARMITITYLSVTEIARPRRSATARPVPPRLLQRAGDVRATARAHTADWCRCRRTRCPGAPTTAPGDCKRLARLFTRSIFELATAASLRGAAALPATAWCRGSPRRRSGRRRSHRHSADRRVAADLVVVVEFLAGLDGADGLDEHPAVLDHATRSSDRRL